MGLVITFPISLREGRDCSPMDSCLSNFWNGIRCRFFFDIVGDFRWVSPILVLHHRTFLLDVCCHHIQRILDSFIYTISLLGSIFIVASLQFPPGFRLESTDLGALHGNLVNIARTSTIEALARPAKRRPHTRSLSLLVRRDGLKQLISGFYSP